MSTAVFFYKKAAQLTQDNIKLTIAKLNAGVDFNISGSLVDSWNSNNGDYFALAEEVMTQNSTYFMMLAVGAASKVPGLKDAVNLIYNLMALLVTAHNDLILIFVKKVAKNAIVEINKKRAVLEQVREDMITLYNNLQVMTAGPQVFDEYLKRLREGLIELYLSRQDLMIVRGALQASDIYLSLKYTEAKDHLSNAEELIKPLTDNPYLNDKQPWKTLLLNAGFPTTNDQLVAIAKLPKNASAVCKSLKGYAQETLTLNALILAYISALDSLTTKMPDIIKNYIISLMNQTILNMNDLIGDMSTVLNGSPYAYSGPVQGFEPIPLAVSGKGYQWVYEVEFLISILDTLFPEEQLSAFKLSQGAVRVYRQSVEFLKTLDGRSKGQAVLQSKDGQENTASLEVQVFTFLTAATASIVSSSVRKEILTLGQTIINRLDLSIEQDDEIKTSLQRFIDTPIPLEDTLNKLGESLFKVLSDLGLDKAADSLANGDFESFFNLNPATATYTGAALAAIALLKACFGDAEDVRKISEAEDEIKKDKDLLNIKISFNFDLQILLNLKEILRLINLGNLYAEKEAVCGLLSLLGFDKLYKAVLDNLGST